MTDKPGFDAEYAHKSLSQNHKGTHQRPRYFEEPISFGTGSKFFSVECFNAAWKIIDKPVRTAEENEQMIRLAQASIWHWSQRPDCTEKNLSIGYWQASRIYFC